MPAVAASVAHHLRRHQHASRTRIKVPRNVVQQVANRIRQLSQVSDVQVNPSTGSILVHHQSGLDDIVAKMEAAGICEVIGMPEASDALATLGPRVLTIGLIAVFVSVGGFRWLNS